MHPEIQSVGNLPGDRQRVIEYDMKDGDWRGELRTQLVRNDPQRTRYGCAPCTSVPVSAERLYPYRRYGPEACTMVHRAPPVPRYSCTGTVGTKSTAAP